MSKHKIMSVFGTRPEAIKMAPLVQALKRLAHVESLVCVTGQHRDMLDQVLNIFSIRPDVDLNIMRFDQDLTSITTRTLEGLAPVLSEYKPELVLVHGDTTTSVSAALAAFYQKIPVAHVEAGLRSMDPYSPYPEEMNRCLISRLAQLHFAPTAANADNLRRENVLGLISVTGNTVIDALMTTVYDTYEFQHEFLRSFDFDSGPTILLTAHRRENFGQPIVSICRAVRRLVEDHPGLRVIYPVHPNPQIQQPVRQELADIEHLYLIEPLDVQEMHNLMDRCSFVMTDSGGLQEEAPALGKPVLVLRTETERPEAVVAGTVEIAGVEEEGIYQAAHALLTDRDKFRRMATAVNPYGDGRACERILGCIETWLGS
ncbi:MAG: UDP-N-acetylglucosamine 2-epimerase (non-hydrolyzing) [Peptococcaceae bacterium]|nr:UDP-N-acetylglucosamine 2-epimerase (non-hydrolyzing) [Peptococcaceae bacterium]